MPKPIISDINIISLLREGKSNNFIHTRYGVGMSRIKKIRSMWVGPKPTVSRAMSALNNEAYGVLSDESAYFVARVPSRRVVRLSVDKDDLFWLCNKVKIQYQRNKDGPSYKRVLEIEEIINDN